MRTKFLLIGLRYENNWSSLVSSYIASNPLVSIVQGTHLDIQSASCLVGPVTVFGRDVSLNFCPWESYYDAFGVLIVGVFGVYSIMVAMGKGT
jgi:hypothetical protein